MGFTGTISTNPSQGARRGKNRNHRIMTTTAHFEFQSAIGHRKPVMPSLENTADHRPESVQTRSPERSSYDHLHLLHEYDAR
jgi:hypothetical protein